MKKAYEPLEVEVVRFDDEDVITASGGQDCPPIAICNKVCPPDGIPICLQKGSCGCNCPVAEAVCQIT